MPLIVDRQNRYYDPKFESMCVNILPGEYCISTDAEEMLVTVLGSCVAACIRDPLANVGGINHFLLAEPSAEIISQSNRYGSFAMECLINDIIKNGGQKNRLEAKIFGGANLFQSRLKIGEKNIEFVKQYLEKERITLISEDVGGAIPRRIHYWPSTGKALRLALQPSAAHTVLDQ